MRKGTLKVNLFRRSPATGDEFFWEIRHCNGWRLVRSHSYTTRAQAIRGLNVLLSPSTGVVINQNQWGNLKIVESLFSSRLHPIS